MARPEFIKRARKPNPVVSQQDIEHARITGQPTASYWKWSFRYGGTHYSKTRPRPSQLTQSEYLSGVYGLQEDMKDARPETPEDLRAERDGWVELVREIGDECREKFDNMPEGLQMGETGELLERRADAMELWADDLENVDLEDNGDEDDDIDDWVEEKLDELQSLEPEVE